MEKVGILGYGEVGRAIANFCVRPKIKDKGSAEDLAGVDVLHVCIPYSKDFIKIVKKEIDESAPGLTIIHSTVPLGTTKKIGGMIVHSPIRGVHPILGESIKTFVKYVGWDLRAAGLHARKHFQKLGIKTHMVSGTRNTEALKLWSTTQYGLSIILNKEIKKFCVKNRLNFDVVYTAANKSYNKGYLELNRPEVVRSVLKHMPGKIGGHCVIPNCGMLDSILSRFILKLNR